MRMELVLVLLGVDRVFKTHKQVAHVSDLSSFQFKDSRSPFLTFELGSGLKFVLQLFHVSLYDGDGLLSGSYFSLGFLFIHSRGIIIRFGLHEKSIGDDGGDPGSGVLPDQKLSQSVEASQTDRSHCDHESIVAGTTG